MRPVLLVKKWVLLTHRWTGIIFSLLFLAWFISGIVLMYIEFPVLKPGERLKHMPVLDGSAIHVSPASAADLAKIHNPEEIRLSSLLGRPAYHFRSGQKMTVIFADRAEVFHGLNETEAKQIAANWLNQSIALIHLEEKQVREDQWTVPQKYRPLRPLWKFEGADGQVVYVSDVTGEVVQHTDRVSRWGSYFGAIPHWVYFTKLRKDAAEWRLVVIWLSGAGTLMTLLGLAGGIWLYSPSKRYRFQTGPSSVPFAGQKRWHLILGFLFGVTTFTWVLSGMFSMTPIRWTPETVETQVNRSLNAHADEASLQEFSQHPPQWALASLGSTLPTRELELTKIAGKYSYYAEGSSNQTALLDLDSSQARSVDPESIIAVVNRAIAPLAVIESHIVISYDTYYVDRHNLKPLPALYIRLNDPNQCFFYIDLRNGRVAQSYGRAALWNRWLYHGLHSFDLPWLYRTRPVWDILVISLMLGGIALSVTGCIIAVRRLNRRVIKPLQNGSLRKTFIRSRPTE
ncbi:PepSY domain-containing protein [Granulicella sp. dw_53]|uniref:PepSY domain-containing protein n=1 Tax=Granulicella sp. dw_53 TaxID=2719792 RepID=UPI001BD38455|nr:PepSY domain-containing protein [Granulicella sp. dw_53]